MYLKNDRIVAEIGDSDGDGFSARIVMRSYKTGLGNEYILDPTAVMGWDDGAIVRRVVTQRMNGHGDFKEPATFGSRMISLSGTAVAKTRFDLRRMRDDMMSLFTTTEYESLSIEINGSKRWSKVGLEGTTSWVQQADTFASWRISFYAPDPHLYGEMRVIKTGNAPVYKGGIEFPLAYPLKFTDTLSTAVTIENRGNAPAWPIFMARGTFNKGFSIYDNRGNVVTYTGMVTSVSPVSIDMAAGTAMQNGIDKTTLITKRDWFSIMPNSSFQPEFVPTADGIADNTAGWCDIIFRDTWI